MIKLHAQVSSFILPWNVAIKTNWQKYVASGYKCIISTDLDELIVIFYCRTNFSRLFKLVCNLSDTYYLVVIPCKQCRIVIMQSDRSTDDMFPGPLSQITRAAYSSVGDGRISFVYSASPGGIIEKRKKITKIKTTDEYQIRKYKQTS